MWTSILVSSLALGAVACGTAGARPDTPGPVPVRNVVLVHGGFVDGGGWEPLYHKLVQDGFHVSVVQNSTVSLADDVAATKRVLAMQNGPTILVGHSYGGAVITEAGNDPNVVALVYVCAFGPDAGESVETLIGGFPKDGPQPPILPPQDGFLMLDRTKFHAAFAGDLKPERAAFLADAQVPWGLGALSGKVSQAAWRTKPAWYLVTTDDQMIPRQAQVTMAQRMGATTSEVGASHAVYESKPADVAGVIVKASHVQAAR